MPKHKMGFLGQKLSIKLMNPLKTHQNDHKMICSIQLYKMNENLASIYNEKTEGVEESKTTLGRIYDVGSVIILSSIVILFVLVVVLATKA